MELRPPKNSVAIIYSPRVSDSSAASCSMTSCSIFGDSLTFQTFVQEAVFDPQVLKRRATKGFRRSGRRKKSGQSRAKVGPKSGQSRAKPSPNPPRFCPGVAPRPAAERVELWKVERRAGEDRADRTECIRYRAAPACGRESAAGRFPRWSTRAGESTERSLTANTKTH